MKLPRHVARLVERYLANYELDLSLVLWWEEEVKTLKPGRDAVSPREVWLLLTAEKVAVLRPRLRAIQETLETLSSLERQIAERAYIRPDGSTHAVLAGELGVSEREFYRLRGEVLRRFAPRLGLVGEED